MKTKKKGKWDKPTGPLTEYEMKDWSRMIQIRKMIEGTIIGDTSERAWQELSAYKSMPRIFVDVCSSGILFNEPTGERRLFVSDFPLTPLGFKAKDGMKFMILGADITPEEKPKPKPKKKAKTFLLNETHTTHLTKSQLRKEMREARKKRKK